MLNITNEKLVGGLHQHLEDNGCKLLYINNVWVVSKGDEQSIQNLHDTFNPLPKIRVAAKTRLITQVNEAMAALEASYPEVEKRTFIKQENEAKAYVLDNTVPTLTLTPIATARGITVADLAARVVAKSNEYTSQVATLIGARQALEDQIDSEADWTVLQNTNMVV